MTIRARLGMRQAASKIGRSYTRVNRVQVMIGVEARPESYKGDTCGMCIIIGVEAKPAGKCYTGVLGLRRDLRAL